MSEETTEKAPQEAEQNLLVANDIYLKAGIHIGTKFKTKDMKKFIYKTRNDGLSVLNLEVIDERIKLTANFLANYAPEEILFVSRREGSFKALKLMKKLVGFNAFAGRYPPGVLTNPALENFIEPRVVVVSDPWADQSTVKDTTLAGITLLGFCDTNNLVNDLDLILPCNNKGKKSLGLIYYLLTREYMIKRGMIKNAEEFSASIEDFTEE